MFCFSLFHPKYTLIWVCFELESNDEIINVDYFFICLFVLLVVVEAGEEICFFFGTCFFRFFFFFIYINWNYGYGHFVIENFMFKCVSFVWVFVVVFHNHFYRSKICWKNLFLNENNEHWGIKSSECFFYQVLEKYQYFFHYTWICFRTIKYVVPMIRPLAIQMSWNNWTWNNLNLLSQSNLRAFCKIQQITNKMASRGN